MENRDRIVVLLELLAKHDVITREQAQAVCDDYVDHVQDTLFEQFPELRGRLGRDGRIHD